MGANAAGQGGEGAGGAWRAKGGILGSTASAALAVKALAYAAVLGEKRSEIAGGSTIAQGADDSPGRAVSGTGLPVERGAAGGTQSDAVDHQGGRGIDGSARGSAGVDAASSAGGSGKSSAGGRSVEEPNQALDSAAARTTRTVEAAAEEDDDDDAVVEAEVGIPREVLSRLDLAADAITKARVTIVLQASAAKSSCEGPTARPNAWRDRHLTLGAGAIYYKRRSADTEAKGVIPLEAIRAVAALPLPAGLGGGRGGTGRRTSAVTGTGSAVLAAWRTTGGGVSCTAEELDLVVARFRPRQLRPFMVWVRVPDKSYFFAMSSEEQRRQWVLVLRAVVYVLEQAKRGRA